MNITYQHSWCGDQPRIEETLHLELTNHTYLPKTKDPREDWIESVVVPAFLALRNARTRKVNTFATVGTGAALDALAAIEILNPDKVMMTDVHRDVVDKSISNVTCNLRAGHTINVAGDVGELALPLINSGCKYDVVYENLPNIPLPKGRQLTSGAASGSFTPGNLSAAKTAGKHLLDLHSHFLSQSGAFLSKDGIVLSAIGARIPIEAILEMADEAGCESEILTFTWKLQLEAHENVSAYAKWSERGKGPFHFYPETRVKEVFSRFPSPEIAAKHALEIERELANDRIYAKEALELVQRQVPIAHTVAMLESRPRISH